MERAAPEEDVQVAKVHCADKVVQQAVEQFVALPAPQSVKEVVQVTKTPCADSFVQPAVEQFVALPARLSVNEVVQVTKTPRADKPVQQADEQVVEAEEERIRLVEEIAAAEAVVASGLADLARLAADGVDVAEVPRKWLEGDLSAKPQRQLAARAAREMLKAEEERERVLVEFSANEVAVAAEAALADPPPPPRPQRSRASDRDRKTAARQRQLAARAARDARAG